MLITMMIELQHADRLRQRIDSISFRHGEHVEPGLGVVMISKVWRNARLATMDAWLPGLGLIERGAVAADVSGHIADAGPHDGLPSHLHAPDQTS
jgi:hypothetical protein